MNNIIHIIANHGQTFMMILFYPVRLASGFFFWAFFRIWARLFSHTRLAYRLLLSKTLLKVFVFFLLLVPAIKVMALIFRAIKAARIAMESISFNYYFKWVQQKGGKKWTKISGIFVLCSFWDLCTWWEKCVLTTVVESNCNRQAHTCVKVSILFQSDLVSILLLFFSSK